MFIWLYSNGMIKQYLYSFIQGKKPFPETINLYDLVLLSIQSLKCARVIGNRGMYETESKQSASKDVFWSKFGKFGKNGQRISKSILSPLSGISRLWQCQVAQQQTTYWQILSQHAKLFHIHQMFSCSVSLFSKSYYRPFS